MNSNQKVVKLATIVYGAMTKDTRYTGVEYWRLRDDAPQWVRKFVDAIHEDGAHEDFTFQFILESVCGISELDEAALDRDGFDAIELEADAYLGDLLRWLCDDASRQEYVNDAYNEQVAATYADDRYHGRTSKDGYTPKVPELFYMLQAGQLREMNEVFSDVLDYLRNV